MNEEVSNLMSGPTHTSSVSEPSSSSSGSSSLRPDSIGSVGVTATVVSAAAPLTVMAGVAPVALAIGGVGVPGAYLLAGVVLCVFAVGFTAMAAQIRRTGGFFVYIGHAFGGTAGFAAAVLAIVSYNLLQIGTYGLFGIQTQAALDDLFGVTAPWWVISAIAVVAVFILGALGIDVGAKVLVVLITLESAILAIMGISIIAQGGASGLGVASFDPGRWCRRSARLMSRPGPGSWGRRCSSPPWISTSAAGPCTRCTS
jgi:amino acid transporter